MNTSTEGVHVMSNFSNPADVCAVYLAELEQLDEKLRGLRKRVSTARRVAKTGHVHWAHVGEVKHLNCVFTELVETWQPCHDESKRNVKVRA